MVQEGDKIMEIYYGRRSIRQRGAIALLLAVALIFISGCQKQQLKPEEVNTYNEVIENGEVIVDGILYEIRSVSTYANVYDENDNKVESISTHEDFSPDKGYKKNHSTYTYEGKLLTEAKHYSGDSSEPHSEAFYTYKNGKRVSEKMVTGKKKWILMSEYSYGDKYEKIDRYNNDGNIAFSAELELDDDGNMMKSYNRGPNGEIIAITEYTYKDDLVLKAVNTVENELKTVFNYEYNNAGDIMVEYRIRYLDGTDNDLYLNMDFYDYQYDGNLNPVKITKHEIRDRIKKENIRSY